MSERRCQRVWGGRRCCLEAHSATIAHCYVGPNGWLFEPQEGASSVDVAGSRTTGTCPAVGTAGAPPCDSPELAAARETVTNCDCMCAEAGQALLRMVDELREASLRTIEGLKTVARQYETERDELRAKLAKAEKGGDEWRKTLTLTEQRAEAAEARVKELETTRGAESDELLQWLEKEAPALMRKCRMALGPKDD